MNVLVLHMITQWLLRMFHSSFCGLRFPSICTASQVANPQCSCSDLVRVQKGRLGAGTKEGPMVLEGYLSMDSSLYLMIFVDVHPRINMYNI